MEKVLEPCLWQHLIMSLDSCAVLCCAHASSCSPVSSSHYGCSLAFFQVFTSFLQASHFPPPPPPPHPPPSAPRHHPCPIHTWLLVCLCFHVMFIHVQCVRDSFFEVFLTLCPVCVFLTLSPVCVCVLDPVSCVCVPWPCLHGPREKNSCKKCRGSHSMGTVWVFYGPFGQTFLLLLSLLRKALLKHPAPSRAALLKRTDRGPSPGPSLGASAEPSHGTLFIAAGENKG